jgi:heme exporter protein A
MLYPELNAEENLAFYGRLYSLPDSPGRVLDVLEMVGLDPLRKDPVRTFSRGMLQRLAIGRAILHDPEVMLLDEPHSGLDQAACGMLNQALSRVAGSGRTILMATHDLLRADELASRFDVLSRGDLLASTDRAGLDLYGGLYAFYQAALS